MWRGVHIVASNFFFLSALHGLVRSYFPDQGANSTRPPLKAGSPNHWTTRESPASIFKDDLLYYQSEYLLYTEITKNSI